MPSPRAIWASLDRKQKAVAVAGPGLLAAAGGALAVALALNAPPPVAIATPTPTVRATPAPLPPTPSPAPNATPTPTPSPSPPGTDPLLGTDGRFTVLLLGSDYRRAHPGNRTDAIMVVSLDPVSGMTGAFSIPRDTIDFPLPDGGVFRQKANALYNYLQSTTGDGGDAMKVAVGRAFALEVDFYVFIGFQGVEQLVDAIGGVDVTLEKAYYDPYYWVTSTRRGWGLSAGTSHLDGDDALILARSRKGDNDFGRSRRQQLLVMAALDKVRGLGPTVLPRLLEIGAATVRTDLPLDRAVDLLEIAATADLDGAKRNVFGPRKYADGRGGSTFSLKLDVCLAWIEANFPPERPLGQWPPPTPTPSPSPAPSPTAGPTLPPSPSPTP